MSNDINIDFSPLTQHPVDPMGDFINAFQVGQALHQQSMKQAALAKYATDPAGAASGLIQAGDINGGLALQQNNQEQDTRTANASAAGSLAQGDYQGAESALAPTGNIAQIAQLQGAQREAAKQRNEQLAVALHQIGTIQDPAQRLSVAQHMAQTIGIDPSTITADDVTDQGIAGHMAQVMTIDQVLEHDKPQVVGKDSRLLFAPGTPGATAPPAAGGDTPQPAGAGPAPTGQIPDMITAAAQKYGVDPQLALSVAHAESNFNPAARSPKGAIGTMQLMPATAQSLGVDPTDPAQNIDGGVRYLAQLSKQFNGDPKLIAAAYNAGPGAVTQHGGVPPYAETQAYVSKVTGGLPAGSYQVASNGATPGPPADQTLPGGYRLVDPSGGASGNSNGHVSTPAELKQAGLPATAQAWTNAKGEVGAMNPALSSQVDAANATANPQNLNGVAFLHTLAPSEQALVLAFDQGRAPIPTGAALRNPMLAKAFQDTAQFDPAFDAATYSARQKTRSAFTSGQPAAAVTSANTLMGHLDALDKQVDALGNVSVPVVGGLYNQAKNAFSDPTSGTLSTFNTLKSAVSAEAARVFQGSAPHETEMKAWQAQFDAAKSPQQLHSAVQALAVLVASRVNNLGDQYNEGMGRTQDGLTLLRPDAAATMARLGGQDGSRAAAKASFYQQAEKNGMAPSEVGVAWQKYDGQRSAHAAHASAKPGYTVLGVE